MHIREEAAKEEQQALHERTRMHNDCTRESFFEIDGARKTLVQMYLLY